VNLTVTGGICGNIAKLLAELVLDEIKESDPVFYTGLQNQSNLKLYQ
jgi:hypothetical protein